MSMLWDTLSAVGELVGAFAVVASLVYLAALIRVQNKESKIASMHEISIAHREAVAAICDGPMADIFAKAMKDFDSLSSADTLRIIGFVYRFFKIWEEAYFQYKANRLDFTIWDSMTRQYTAYLSMEPFKRIWELRSEYVAPEFRDYVNSRKPVDLVLPNSISNRGDSKG
ncbi:hypothetical protein [Microbulbifer sp. JMSA003]|uniref:hypothetical protein n=1 Tax=unclassified Microbulbifer TaxID=2619833 RepID=UPI0040398CB6